MLWFLIIITKGPRVHQQTRLHLNYLFSTPLQPTLFLGVPHVPDRDVLEAEATLVPSKVLLLQLPTPPNPPSDFIVALAVMGLTVGRTLPTPPLVVVVAAAREAER